MTGSLSKPQNLGSSRTSDGWEEGHMRKKTLHAKCSTLEGMADALMNRGQVETSAAVRDAAETIGQLRKLVVMMWLVCESKGIVGGLYTYPDRNSNACESVNFERVMRELGVEVDG